MSELRAFLCDLTAQGFILEPEGGNIIIEPFSRLTAEHIGYIRTHKAELLALLRDSATRDPYPLAELEAAAHRLCDAYGDDEAARAAMLDDVRAYPPEHWPWLIGYLTRQAEEIELAASPAVDRATTATGTDWDRIRDRTARGYRAEFGPPGPDGKQSVTWHEPEPQSRGAADFPPDQYEIVHFSEYQLKSGRRVSFDLAIPKDRYDGFEIIWILDQYGSGEARP